MATLDILINAKNNASSAINDVTNSLEKLNKKTTGMDSAFGNLQKTITVGVVGAMAAMGTAVAGAGVALAGGVRKAADLEQQLANIASVTGKTMDEMQPFKDLITDLSIDPSLKVNTTEAADAIEMLARNGLSMDEILQGATRSTVLLANATGADFGMAADIATDVMALFNINAADMSQAVNGITSVVTNSKFSIDDYAYALAQGGGVAASVGVELADFNTTIAAISPFFSSGSDAGTSFKTMLQRLVPASGPAEDAMKQLGIITADGVNQFFTATGEMRSMAEISGVLQRALFGLSEEQKNNAVSTIFGTDAMRVAFGLAEIGEGNFRQLAQSMSLTDAAQASATRMDTFAGSMEILSGIIESVQIQIGSLFLPILNRLALVLIDLSDLYGPKVVAWFEMFASQLDVVFNYVEALAVEGNLLNDSLGALPNIISASIRRFVNFQYAVTNVTHPIVEIIERFVTWQDVLTAVGFVVASIVIPAFGSFVLAASPVLLLFGALVAAASTLRRAWDENFGGIRDFIGRAVESIKTSFGGVMDGSVSLGDAVKTAFGAIVTYVTENLPTWRTKLAEWGSALIAWISNNIEPAKTKLGEWYTAISGWIALQLPFWIETLKAWGDALWGFIEPSIEPAKTKLGEWYSALVSWLDENLPDWTKAILTWATELVDWIGEAIPKAIVNLGDFLLALIGYGDSDITPGLERQGGNFASALIDWVQTDLIPQITPEFDSFKESLNTAIDNTVEAITETAAKLGPPLYKWLTEDALPKIVENMETLRSTVIEELRVMDEDGNIYAGALANHFERISDAIDNIGEWLTSLRDWWKELNPEVKQGIVEFGLMAITLRGLWPIVQTLSNWLGVTGLIGTISKVIDWVMKKGGLNAVFRSLGSRLGLVGLAVSLLALAWETNFLDIQTHTGNAVDWIEEKWETLTTNLSEWWSDTHESIGTTLSTKAEEIKTEWDNFTGWISDGWETLTTNLSTWWSDTHEGIGTKLSTKAGEIETAWDEFTTNISDGWETLTDNLGTWWNNTVTGFNTNLSTARTNVETAWTNFSTNISTGWSTLTTNLGTWWNNTVTGFNTNLSTARTNVETAWTNFRTNISTGWSTLTTNLGTWWNNTVTGFNTNLSTARTNVETAWTNFSTNISDGWETLTTNLSTWWDEAITGIVTLISESSLANSGMNFISTLWANWSSQNIINSINSVATDIKNRFVWAFDWFKDNAQALQTTGVNFLTTLWSRWGSQNIINSINSVATDIKNRFVWAFDWFKDNAQALQTTGVNFLTTLWSRWGGDNITTAISSAVTTVRNNIAGAFDWFKDNAQALQTTGVNFLTTLWSRWGGDNITTAISSAVTTVRNNIAGAFDWFKDNAQALQTTGASFIATLWSQWGGDNITTAISSAVTTVRNNIAGAFDWFKDNAQALQTTGASFIATLWSQWGGDNITTAISSAVTTVRNNIAGAFDWFKDNAQALQTTGVNFLTTLWSQWGGDNITTAISSAVTTVRNNIAGAFDWFKDNAQALQTTGASFIATLWATWNEHNAVQAMITAATDVKDNIKKSFQLLIDNGTALAWQGGEFLKTLWANWGSQDIINRISTAAGGIRDRIGNALGNLYSIGGDLIQGLANGLRERWQQLIQPGQSFYETFRAIMEWIRSWFGISSPSKAMEDIGNNLMLGMANGIIDELPTVIAAAQLMANGVMGVANSMSLNPQMALSASAMGTGGNGNLIRPSITNNATYNLNYQTMQSAGSVQQDIELLNLLYGGQL